MPAAPFSVFPRPRGSTAPSNIHPGTEGPAVLLVHGFGASAYHWRYVVPQLARSCRVFAIDLLGFGWSDKPLVDYSGYNVWADQCAAFLQEVVGGPAVVVGNSMGGFNALNMAARTPDLVRWGALMRGRGEGRDLSCGECGGKV